jgi:hypothetical protein
LDWRRARRSPHPVSFIDRHRGAERVDGSITLRFASDSQQVLAVRPRDYIYPNDVRIDERTGLLYVKARGLAGGIVRQT